MSSDKTKRAQFLIQFGYLGDCFHGVQPQKHVPTVGQAVKEHLIRAAGITPSALQFAARTDKGVHALSSFATCWFRPPFDSEQFIRRVVAIKTTGLLAVRAIEVPHFVHARGSSRGKHYRYTLEDGGEHRQTNPYAWQIAPKLNIKHMQKAAEFLLGEHDFTSFRAADCTANSPIKRIFRLEVNMPSVLKHRQIHIDIVGDAFVRKMVRIIAGTLAEVGAGLRHPHEMPEIISAKKRWRAGIVAPAHGLTLIHLGFDWPLDGSNLLACCPQK